MRYAGILLPVIEVIAIAYMARGGMCRRYPAVLTYLAAAAAAQVAVLIDSATWHAVQPALLIARALAILELCRAGQRAAVACMAALALVPVFGSMFVPGGLGYALLPYTEATRSAAFVVFWLGSCAITAGLALTMARSRPENVVSISARKIRAWRVAA